MTSFLDRIAVILILKAGGEVRLSFDDMMLLNGGEVRIDHDFDPKTGEDVYRARRVVTIEGEVVSPTADRWWYERPGRPVERIDNERVGARLVRDLGGRYWYGRKDDLNKGL